MQPARFQAVTAVFASGIRYQVEGLLSGRYREDNHGPNLLFFVASYFLQNGMRVRQHNLEIWKTIEIIYFFQNSVQIAGCQESGRHLKFNVSKTVLKLQDVKTADKNKGGYECECGGLYVRLSAGEVKCNKCQKDFFPPQSLAAACVEGKANPPIDESGNLEGESSEPGNPPENPKDSTEEIPKGPTEEIKDPTHEAEPKTDEFIPASIGVYTLVKKDRTGCTFVWFLNTLFPLVPDKKNISDQEIV